MQRICIFLLVLFTSISVHAVNVHEIDLTSTFTYEYDSGDNPKGHEWCGHAALVTVVNHYLPDAEHVNMSTLHQHWLSIDNTGEYSNHDFCGDNHGWTYCASLNWMHSYVFKKKAWSGLGLKNSVIRYAYSIDELYSKIKDSLITWKFPIITPSKYDYDHNWVIAGIVDFGDANSSYIKLYDVAKSKGENGWYKWVNLKEFYDADAYVSGRFDLLIIKPNN